MGGNLRNHGAAIVGDVHVDSPVVGVHDDEHDLAIGVHERSGIEVLRLEGDVGSQAYAARYEVS